MIPLTRKTQFTVAIALLVPFLLSLWMMLVPKTVSPFTYAWSVTILVTLAAITLNSWRNGRATASIAQVLHETEVARRQD
jgi:hypothetical protein